MNENMRVIDEPSLDLLNILNAYWRRALVVACAFAAAVFLIAQFLPDRYSSTAIIVDPQVGWSEPGLIEFIGVTNKPLGLKVATSILRSRPIFERLIAKFELARVYAEEDPDELLRILQKNVSVTQTKVKTIKIQVRDKDPQRAADMANALTDMLREILQADVKQPPQLNEKRFKSPLAAGIYELAIAVSNSHDVVYVLEKAQPARKPDSPKRLLLALLGALLGGFGVLMYAVIFEWRKLWHSSDRSAQS